MNKYSAVKNGEVLGVFNYSESTVNGILSRHGLPLVATKEPKAIITGKVDILPVVDVTEYHEDMTNYHIGQPTYTANGEQVDMVNAVTLLSAEVVAKRIREERNELIAKYDWAGSTDVVMTDEIKEYRQALRDITEQDGFPYEVEWPVSPDAENNQP